MLVRPRPVNFVCRINPSETADGAEAQVLTGLRPKSQKRAEPAGPALPTIRLRQPLLRLAGRQTARALHLAQVQPARREFRNRVPGPGSDFHIEYLGTDRAANRPLV